MQDITFKKIKNSEGLIVGVSAYRGLSIMATQMFKNKIKDSGKFTFYFNWKNKKVKLFKNKYDSNRNGITKN